MLLGRNKYGQMRVPMLSESQSYAARREFESPLVSATNWWACTYRIANFPVGGLDVRNPLRMQMPALRLPILFCIQPSNAWKQWRPGAVPRPKDR